MDDAHTHTRPRVNVRTRVGTTERGRARNRAVSVTAASLLPPHHQYLRHLSVLFFERERWASRVTDACLADECETLAPVSSPSRCLRWPAQFGPVGCADIRADGAAHVGSGKPNSNAKAGAHASIKADARVPMLRPMPMLILSAPQVAVWLGSDFVWRGLVAEADCTAIPLDKANALAPYHPLSTPARVGRRVHGVPLRPLPAPLFDVGPSHLHR
eukprot:6187376-Pleurochrysis_carterae.AAC.1